MTNRKYILNHLYGSSDALFNELGRDNCNEPYVKLRQRFEALGYVCDGAKDHHLEDAKWILFWDASALGDWRYRLKARLRGYPARNVFREALRKEMGDRMVLLMFEPPSVCPENYDFELHRHFAKILTWDPSLVDRNKYYRIYLPSPTTFPVVRRVPISEKKLLINISSYKFSSHPRELYSEIRRTVRFFEEHYPDQFDLYGYGWNRDFLHYFKDRLVHPNIRRERYPSYRGVAENKAQLYERYKFGLCYENMIDQPGYVSLKIFDCLRSGSVPVYLGAPDIGEYVDKEAFVHRREFGTTNELAKYLASMTDRQYNRYADAGIAYLQSEKFKLFLSDNFVETIVRVLGLAHVQDHRNPIVLHAHPEAATKLGY